MMNLLKLFVSLIVTVLVARAGDVSGVWTGKLYTEPRGGGASNTLPVRLDLKQEGARVRGMAGPSERDCAEIRTGTVDAGTVNLEVPLPGGKVLRFRLAQKGDDAMAGTFAGEGMQDFQGKVEVRKGGGAASLTADAGEVRLFDDVRGMAVGPPRKDVRALDLSRFDGLATLTFNQNTVWPEAAHMPNGPAPADLLEAAKNPGLGVRALHRQGITGKGVTVAIIDQPLYLNHPEFAGKVAAYENFAVPSPSSMHGPAVLSLLAGKSNGVAPDAKVYFAVAASWLQDAGLFSQALDWIVEQNRRLPPDGRIRVVSVSAAPSQAKIFPKNTDSWRKAVTRAEAEGILVLDCTDEFGLVSSCWLRGKDREDPASWEHGYAGLPAGAPRPGRLSAPTSPRTVAEQYQPEGFGYTYCGRGGLSWAIPYAAGVLALGWQVRPELTGKEMMDLLYRSAFGEGKVIHPQAFVKAVREYRR